MEGDKEQQHLQQQQQEEQSQQPQQPQQPRQAQPQQPQDQQPQPTQAQQPQQAQQQPQQPQQTQQQAQAQAQPQQSQQPEQAEQPQHHQQHHQQGQEETLLQDPMSSDFITHFPPNMQGEGSGDGNVDDVNVVKRKAGRRKIPIEFIDDKSRRQITFSKRKAGLMKKAYELTTLTGTQALLLVASETGHVYTFATPKLQPFVTIPEGKSLIQACLNAPDPQPLGGPQAAGQPPSRPYETSAVKRDDEFEQGAYQNQQQDQTPHWGAPSLS